MHTDARESRATGRRASRSTTIARLEAPRLSQSDGRLSELEISTSSFKVTVIPSHAGSGLLRIASMSADNSGWEATFAYSA
jgi:hypothetical protein